MNILYDAGSKDEEPDEIITLVQPYYGNDDLYEITAG